LPSLLLVALVQVFVVVYASALLAVQDPANKLVI